MFPSPESTLQAFNPSQVSGTLIAILSAILLSLRPSAIIFSASKGHLDDLDVDQISDFESGLFEYLDANALDSLKSIVNEGSISEETEEKLEKAIVDYKAGFSAKE